MTISAPVALDETSSIKQLVQAFELLNKQASKLNIFIVEKQKLYIIQLFEIALKREIPREYTLPILPKHEVNYALNQRLREMIYYFLLVFGLFENIAGSYLFGHALFSLIPGISNPALMITTFIFTILSSVLFYAFEVTFLKTALGIPYSDTEFAQLIDTYSRKLKTTVTINQLLSTMHMQNIDPVIFDEYRQLLKLLNQDQRNKNEAMDPYPESWLKNMLNAGILAFGALSSIAGSYFFVNALMLMAFPALVGTPIGWGIMVLTIISGLGFYYAMDATSMIRLANPVRDSYDLLKKELALFNDNYRDDLSSVKSTKDRFTKKQTRDASTQMDDDGFAFFKSPKFAKEVIYGTPNELMTLPSP